MIYSARYKNNTDVSKEDPRVSTIIGTLLYLPDYMIWTILRNSCFNGDSLPVYAGVLELYQFWPRWNAENTDNTNNVSPDVFLRFANFDVIIEAKRSDWMMQDSDQWQNELQAYKNEYAKENRSVYLIALGGNNSTAQNETIKINGEDKTVYKCSWANIHCEISKLQAEYNLKRILDALRMACNLFGFHTYSWLADKTELISKLRIDCSENEKLFIRK